LLERLFDIFAVDCAFFYLRMERNEFGNPVEEHPGLYVMSLVVVSVYTLVLLLAYTIHAE